MNIYNHPINDTVHVIQHDMWLHSMHDNVYKI